VKYNVFDKLCPFTNNTGQSVKVYFFWKSENFVLN